MEESILIKADGSSKIGLGHLTRQIDIANELKSMVLIFGMMREFLLPPFGKIFSLKKFMTLVYLLYLYLITLSLVRMLEERLVLLLNIKVEKFFLFILRRLN